MSSTPEEPTQRASAAQMANRKIKDVRRRRPNTGAPASPAPQQSFNSPFSSLGQTSGPPAPSPVAPTNGFTFGQSQSFPGANQPGANGTSPFSFGSGAGGSSFNFSAAPNTTAPSNPFASMNPGGPSQAPDTNGFSGFKGNLFNLSPSGSQAPAQQPLPAGGLFGSTTSAGPSLGATPTAGSIFGQSSVSSPAPATPSGSIFGQPASPEKTTSPFGEADGDSMQTSPDAKSSTTSKPSIFGNGTATAPPPVFGNMGGGGLFSSTTPSSGQSPTKPLFGSKPAEQSAPSSPFVFGASTQSTSTATTSTAAPTNPFATASSPATSDPFQSSNLFSAAPASSAPSSNIFGSSAKPQEEQKKNEDAAPKNPLSFTPSTTSSGPSLFSQSTSAASQPASGDLFGVKSNFGASQPSSTGNIFAPKPSTPAEQSPAKGPEANPFGSLFAPKPTEPQKSAESKPKGENQEAPANPFGSLFGAKPSAPAQEKPSGPAKPSLLSASTSAAGTTKPNLFQPSTLFQPPSSTPSAAPQPAPKTHDPEPTPQPPEAMTPKKLSIDLNKHLRGNVELLNRVRILNDSFKREITQLDPMKDDFDLVILYYMRVRETIGAPTGGEHQPKRKSRNEEGADGKDGPAQKKAKPFGEGIGASSPSSPMNIGQSPVTSTTRKLFASTETPKPSKRKADDEDEGASAKRANGDSATANIFAKTFSNSKSEESDKPETSPSSPFRASTPECDKTVPVSTTPTTSPAKPLFGQPPSVSKPASTPPTTAPANPFAPKPVTSEGAGSSATPAFQIPKFGSGGGTNFFAQFKSQADKDAEKEKRKRKEEDYDSEDEDEAEWERKDAEQQRKKREEYAAQPQKRAKFVIGKGFVFEDDSATSDSQKADEAQKKDEAATNGPPVSSSDSSVLDTKSNSPVKSNIFGHLSATPAEVEENDGDDTEEDEPKEPKATTESTDNDNGDNDFSKALKQSKTSNKPAISAESFGGSTTSPASSSGSLFEGVQSGKGDEGKGEAPKNPFASLFSPKPSGSTTASPSAPAASTSGSTSMFGSSTSGPSLFASSPATGSLFGANQTSKPTDNTWKKDSPIKFASDSSKSESESETKTSEAPKPFSTLFGASPAGSKPPTPAGSSLGFSFGAPSQQTQTSSLFSSAANSTTTSAASTPPASFDNKASESEDGDAAESLPQVDLARGGAGEEDEDVLMETRARGLKFKSTDKNWESQGVGFLKILKNRTTSKSRVLLRADPSGNIVLNAGLMKEIKYSASGNSVQFTIPKPDGTMEQWAIRVKKEEADRLGSTMNEAKA